MLTNLNGYIFNPELGTDLSRYTNEKGLAWMYIPKGSYGKRVFENRDELKVYYFFSDGTEIRYHICKAFDETETHIYQNIIHGFLTIERQELMLTLVPEILKKWRELTEDV